MSLSALAERGASARARVRERTGADAKLPRSTDSGRARPLWTDSLPRLMTSYLCLRLHPIACSRVCFEPSSKAAPLNANGCSTLRFLACKHKRESIMRTRALFIWARPRSLNSNAKHLLVKPLAVWSKVLQRPSTDKAPILQKPIHLRSARSWRMLVRVYNAWSKHADASCKSTHGSAHATLIAAL